MMVLIANIIMPISSIIGMYLIAHKNKLGFLVFLILESCMVYLGLESRNYGLIITSLIFAIMNLYSFRLWSKDEGA